MLIYVGVELSERKNSVLRNPVWKCLAYAINLQALWEIHNKPIYRMKMFVCHVVFEMFSVLCSQVGKNSSF